MNKNVKAKRSKIHLKFVHYEPFKIKSILMHQKLEAYDLKKNN